MVFQRRFPRTQRSAPVRTMGRTPRRHLRLATFCCPTPEPGAHCWWALSVVSCSSNCSPMWARGFLALAEEVLLGAGAGASSCCSDCCQAGTLTVALRNTTSLARRCRVFE